MSDDPENDPRKLAEQRDPEAMARKIERLEAMVARLSAPVARPSFGPGSELPQYKLNSACFLEDQLFEEGSIITYTDLPNLEMVPLNDAARSQMQEYLGILEAGARAKAEQAGRPFVGLMTDRGVMIAQAHTDAVEASKKVTIAMPVDKGVVPPMPHTPEAQAKRGRGRPRKVVSFEPPPKADAPRPDAPGIIGRDFSRSAAG